MTRSSFIRIVLLVALVAGIVAGLIYRAELSEWFVNSRDWIRQQGIWGYVILGLAYIPAAVLFIPGSWLTLGGGVAFGLWAVVPVSLGSTAGASAAFLVSRYLARHWVEERIARSPRFQALDRAVGEQGFKIVLLTRLSPVIPFNFLNYAYGLTRVRIGDFLLASWIGMLPGTFLYVYIGSAGAEAVAGEKSLAEWIFFGIGLVLTIVVTVMVTRLARKALAEAVPEEGPSMDVPSEHC
jgi:uncharacterized membrane protein YdjX (TVP38/TMEM64 family)